MDATITDNLMLAWLLFCYASLAVLTIAWWLSARSSSGRR